ncbi:Uncharacterised protein [Bordetella pertussis]|nr:Uncharacterised protein [Bordetella pertussis]
MARSSASTTWGGAVKSGSPIPRLMMSRPLQGLRFLEKLHNLECQKIVGTSG